MKKYGYFLRAWVGLTLLAGRVATAQDAQFSQYTFAPVQLNPALAGQERAVTASLNHRTQWQRVAFPYVTSQLTGTFPLIRANARATHWGGVALSVTNDQAGVGGGYRSLAAYATFAYNVPLSPTGLHTVSVGGQAGVIQRSLDFSGARWGEQYNPLTGWEGSLAPSETQLMNSLFTPDTQAGISYAYNPAQDFSRGKRLSLTVGGAVAHLNRPSQSLIRDQNSRLPLRWHLHAQLTWLLSERVELTPSAWWAAQNTARQLLTGLRVGYRLANPSPAWLANCVVSLGGGYRNADAGIATLGVESDRFRLGFSYDVNVSTLQPYSRSQGAFELALAVRLRHTRTARHFSSPFM